MNWLDANASFPFREVNLRQAPYSLPDPVCSQPDASFCDTTALRCNSNINLFSTSPAPLSHGSLDPATEARDRAKMTRGVYRHYAPNATPQEVVAARRGRRLLFCLGEENETRSSMMDPPLRTPRAQALLRDYSHEWHRLYPAAPPPSLPT